MLFLVQVCVGTGDKSSRRSLNFLRFLANSLFQSPWNRSHFYVLLYNWLMCFQTNMSSDFSYSRVQEDHLFNAMLRETVAVKLSIYSLEVKKFFCLSRPNVFVNNSHFFFLVRNSFKWWWEVPYCTQKVYEANFLWIYHLFKLRWFLERKQYLYGKPKVESMVHFFIYWP